jgi:hypothetical protein
LLICIWEIQTKGVAPRVCGEEGCLLVLRDFPFQFETTSRFFFSLFPSSSFTLYSVQIVFESYCVEQISVFIENDKGNDNPV